MMSHLPAMIVVDSLVASEQARSLFPSARQISDNPILCASASSIQCIDELLTSDETIRVGRIALGVTDLLCVAVGELQRRGVFRMQVSRPRLGTAPISMVITWLRRGLCLARAMEALGPTDVVHGVVAGLPDFEPSAPFIPNRFGTPYRSLSFAGFFRSPMAFHDVRIAPPQNYNDTATRSLALKLALAGVQQAVAELVSTLGIDRRTNQPVIAVLGKNEAMRETRAPLLRRGIAMRAVGALPIPAESDTARVMELSDILSRELSPSLRSVLLRDPLLDERQATAIASLLVERLAIEIAFVEASLHIDRSFVDACVATARHTRVLVTNGWHGLRAHQLLALARERGLRVVCFEHGVTVGLAAENAAKIKDLEASTSDFILVASDAAAQSNKAEGVEQATPVVIGLPDQTRAMRFRGLQRVLARRRLGMGAWPKSNERPVLMHVATHVVQGGYSRLVFQRNDSETVEFELELLRNVYAHLDWITFFKPYPTSRGFHSRMPIEDIVKDTNIRIAPDDDLRYLRSAVDVFVTCTPTSTLGWCLGSGAPIVWLDSRRFAPLLDDELRRRFANSFFFIDLDVPGWTLQLRNLLELPLPHIVSAWNAKRAERDQLLADTIFGPTGSGATAATFLSDLARSHGGKSND
jgi:hypothetical protein